MSHFNVYLLDEVKAGQDKAVVRENIAKALNLNANQAKNLLEKEMVLKKGVDHKTALKYVERFSKLGAKCRIEDLTPIKDNTTVDNVTTASIGSSKHCVSCEKPIEEIAERCQFCGFDQNQIVEVEKPPLPIAKIAVAVVTVLATAVMAYIFLL